MIERYCDAVNLIKEDYLRYLNLCSPFIAQLKEETRVKMYQMAWDLLFGGDHGEDKLKEHKQILEDIKQQFTGMKDLAAEEILTDSPNKDIVRHFEQF